MKDTDGEILAWGAAGALCLMGIAVVVLALAKSEQIRAPVPTVNECRTADLSTDRGVCWGSTCCSCPETGGKP